MPRPIACVPVVEDIIRQRKERPEIPLISENLRIGAWNARAGTCGAELAAADAFDSVEE